MCADGVARILRPRHPLETIVRHYLLRFIIRGISMGISDLYLM